MTETKFPNPSRRVAVIDAVRTPIGRYGGALAKVRPDDLAALVIRETANRTGVEPAIVDEVYFGAANQAGEDNHNVARRTLLIAGLPDHVTGGTPQRGTSQFQLIPFGQSETCVSTAWSSPTS